jgi:hypothetical protein
MFVLECNNASIGFISVLDPSKSIFEFDVDVWLRDHLTYLNGVADYVTRLRVMRLMAAPPVLWDLFWLCLLVPVWLGSSFCCF